MLQQRIIKLFAPDVFQRLLSLEDKIESVIESGIALQSQADNAGQLLIVTNPNCRNCANTHQAMMELAQNTPISLLLLTFPHDQNGEHIAQIILAAYQMDGWHKAMQLLEEWYKSKQIREVDKFLITPRIKQIWEKHQEYCWKQKINKTPAIIVSKYYVPEIYSLHELRYVLT